MKDIYLNEINPDMFSMINKHCRRDLVVIRHDSQVIGSLSTIAYLPRMSQDNTDQIRFSIFEDSGERRLYVRPVDRDGTDLTRYSISY